MNFTRVGGVSVVVAAVAVSVYAGQAPAPQAPATPRLNKDTAAPAREVIPPAIERGPSLNK